MELYVSKSWGTNGTFAERKMASPAKRPKCRYNFVAFK